MQEVILASYQFFNPRLAYCCVLERYEFEFGCGGIANSVGGSPVSAVMRPSKMMLLCSAVVTTFNARVRITSPLAVVCEMEWGDSSTSAPSLPICCSKSVVAQE